MPLTDSYGQNVTYPALTDKPNAQTMGQGIVDGVVPRTVMRFPSASVRGATIAKPTAGMVSWLEDVKRLEVYDGNGWVSFAYGTNQWKNVTLESGWINNGNDQGNVQYRVVDLFGEKSIMFRGGVSRTSYPNPIPAPFRLNAVQLPPEARPASLRTMTVPCSDKDSDRITMKLDLNTQGWLHIVGVQQPNNIPAWIGFNGIFTAL